MWSRLKDKALGVRFYKQSLVYGYIADFYCPKALLVVETDGPCHASRAAYDGKRDAVLAAKGLETMRFSSGAVCRNLPAVVALIADKVGKRIGRKGGRL